MADKAAIALVDDEPSVLDSTAMLLRGQGFQVHTFASAEQLLAALDRQGIALSCIVSDVLLPGMSGLELLAEIARRSIRLPVVLITGHGDVRMAVAALKGGAKDFLEKPFAIDDLVAAVRNAVVGFKATDQLERQRQEIAERAALLSGRQREVMSLVVEGYSSKQIGLKLGISPRTVETYRLQIMEKMGAGSVATLVRMASLLATHPATSDRSAG
jgi:FixJ family two-component response regulator